MNFLFKKFAEVAAAAVVGEVAPRVVKVAKEHGPEVIAAAKDKVETAKIYAPVVMQAIKTKLGK